MHCLRRPVPKHSTDISSADSSVPPSPVRPASCITSSHCGSVRPCRQQVDVVKTLQIVVAFGIQIDDTVHRGVQQCVRWSTANGMWARGPRSVSPPPTIHRNANARRTPVHSTGANGYPVRSAARCRQASVGSSRSCPALAHSLRYARRLPGCWLPSSPRHASRITDPGRRARAAVAAGTATTPARFPSGSIRAIRPHAAAGTRPGTAAQASSNTPRTRARRRASRPTPIRRHCTQRQGDDALAPGQRIQSLSEDWIAMHQTWCLACRPAGGPGAADGQRHAPRVRPSHQALPVQDCSTWET